MPYLLVYCGDIRPLTLYRGQVEVTHTCFLTFSISARSLWIILLSSEISFLVFLRLSPCCSTEAWSCWT